jgi:hypothetical protein
MPAALFSLAPQFLLSCAEGPIRARLVHLRLADLPPALDRLDLA